MNLQKLKEAEGFFLRKYPGGFSDPELVEIGKKHKMDQMIAFAQEHFAADRFGNIPDTIENMIKTVSRSSMVSMFEKPKFRDLLRSLSSEDRKTISLGLKDFLHGDQQAGLEAQIDVLKPHKLAKWSVITIIPNYYAPETEVFLKPTTVKGVINYFELENLIYRPSPSWDFYRQYREAILSMKDFVDPVLTPSNAAFCGFLMMSI